MPRYVVQRTFPQGLETRLAGGGAEVCRTVIERNADDGVTWLHSYVSADKHTTFCICDAPTPEPSARQRLATTCRWIRSRRSKSSTPTSTCKGGLMLR